MKNDIISFVRKKWQWLVLVCGISILLVLGAYLFYSSEERTIRENKKQEIKAVATLKTSQITQWRSERTADIIVFSKSMLFARGIKQWLDNRNNPLLEKEIKEVLVPIKTEYGYKDIILASPNGDILLALDSTEVKMDSASSSKVIEAAKRRQLTFSGFYYCSLHKRVHYDIIAPIVDSKNNPIAVLLFRIDPNDFLFPLIQSWPTPSKTSETLLVRKDGDSVIFLNDLLLQNNAALNLRIPLTRKDVPAVQAVLGYKGIFEGKDYRGVAVLAYVAPVPGTPWFMVAKVDKSEIYSELQFRAVFIGLFTIVLILLTAVSLATIYNSRKKNIYRKLLAADKELLDSEAKFRRIVEKSPTAMYFYQLNDKGELIFKSANPKADLLLGVSHQQMVGKTITQAFPNLATTEVPEMYTKVAKGELKTQKFEIEYSDDNVKGFFEVTVYQSVSNCVNVDFIEISDRKRAEKEAQDAQLETSRLLEVAEKSGRAMLSVVEDERLVRNEIRNLNRGLERKVIERTSQLELANKELEAFSYSVSHDLRAPLRHINGFIDLLSSQFSDSLSEKGIDYLNIIKDSARQMGLLIDDLLLFSRTSRQELVKSSIDMNLIYEEVLLELSRYTPNRKIEWIESRLPPVYCDPSLIKQVWVNILSNAIKFTQKKEKAVIEIGYIENENDFVFSVRDNGVGFDMKYANKLFGVFQRLHSKADYEGTGIGLANVQRIIQRHGGRVWAEAATDKGATFYFTLPKQKEEKQ